MNCIKGMNEFDFVRVKLSHHYESEIHLLSSWNWIWFFSIYLYAKMHCKQYFDLNVELMLLWIEWITFHWMNDEKRNQKNSELSIALITGMILRCTKQIHNHLDSTLDCIGMCFVHSNIRFHWNMIPLQLLYSNYYYIIIIF